MFKRSGGHMRAVCPFRAGNCASKGGNPSDVFATGCRGIGGAGTGARRGDDDRDFRTSREIDAACLICAITQTLSLFSAISFLF
jgi:hypothetical protein